MENTFFIPVGRHVKVRTIANDQLNGELKGLINFGGIPAIWIVSVTAGTEVAIEHVCLLNNVTHMTVIKEIDKSKTSSILITDL